MGIRKLKGIMVFYFLFIIGIVIIYMMPFGMTKEYYYAYTTSVCVYFVVLICLLFVHLKTNLDIFEPIVLTSFIYILIFSIAPIIDIINNDTIQFGFDPIAGWVKGSFIFMLSYVFFTIGYSIKNKPNKIDIERKLSYYNDKEIIKLSILLWIVGFLGTLIYLFGTGKSLAYILSVGSYGEMNISNSSDTPLGFIGMLTFSMITAWIYYFHFGKSKTLKILLFTLSVATLLVRGFRSILIIILVAPIILHYLKNNKRPTMGSLLTLLFSIVIMIGAVGFMRNDVRSGEDVDWSMFDGEVIYNALLGNFRRYNVFYGMVENIPEYYSYTLGQNYFYTLVMVIPRAIWPDKPQPVMQEVLLVSTNPVIASTGAAWPNIGEFYMEFGIFGCIVLMYLLGRLLCWTKTFYQGKHSDIHSMIAFSVIIPSLITIIAYGYTPSTFYMIGFLIVPIIIIKKMNRLKVKP